jgi:hypothetical protein
MKTKIKSFFKSSKVKKVLSCFLLVFVFCSVFVFNSSAAESSYQSIAPVSFSNFNGDVTAVAFPGAHSLELKVNANSGRDYLNAGDYLFGSRLKYLDVNGANIPYIQIFLSCNYSSVSLIGRNNYSGSLSASTITDVLSGVTEFEVTPVENSYNSSVEYYYTWDILLGNYFNYDEVFQDGFNAGVNSSEAKDKYYQDGYDVGFSDGVNASGSQNLGHNLLGDTLSAPMRALNQFTLYKSSSGFEVTLGGVVGAAISLTLFIAFLKIFAGG